MTIKLVIVAFSSSMLVVTTVLVQETPSITDSISLAGAVATVIAVIFAGIVNVIAARAAARKAIAPVIEKVDKIEAHVNSDKTRDQGIIATQKSEIDLLREMNNELKKMAALLAQAKQATELTQAVSQAAIAGATMPMSHAPVAPTAAPVLQAIERNTEETAENTKKTDANVQELKEKA